jgi:hypothetical protein
MLSSARAESASADSARTNIPKGARYAGADARIPVAQTSLKATASRSRRLLSLYALFVAIDTAGTQALSPERAWWLRVPAVLLSPRPVFFALRDDDPDDVSARSEPVLLLVWMAGAASVLATPTAGGLLDKPDYDALVLAIWAFVAGGIYGAVGYFVFGFALFFGARLLGSVGDFRRERQIVGFAVAPLALSLLVLLPVRLALYGGDAFRKGGPDEGTGETVLLVIQIGFVAWSLALLVVGVKIVHGWDWFRALAALAAGTALLAAIVGLLATL